MITADSPTLTPHVGQHHEASLTVSVTEAAQMLGVSEPTIYRLVARRFLKILPGLRHKRITRRSLDAYCAGNVLAAR